MEPVTSNLRGPHGAALTSKRVWLAALVLALIVWLMIAVLPVGHGNEKRADSEIAAYLDKGEYLAARGCAYYHYHDRRDKAKLGRWIQTIDKAAVDANLMLQDGWEWRREGNTSYIVGEVKHVGADPVKKFKIRVLYWGKGGRVIDADSTYCLETLTSGKSTQFQIAHRHSSDYKTVSLHVEDVQFE